MATSLFTRLLQKHLKRFFLAQGREPQTPKEWMDIKNLATREINETKAISKTQGVEKLGLKKGEVIDLFANEKEFASDLYSMGQNFIQNDPKFNLELAVKLRNPGVKTYGWTPSGDKSKLLSPKQRQTALDKLKGVMKHDTYQTQHAEELGYVDLTDDIFTIEKAEGGRIGLAGGGALFKFIEKLFIKASNDIRLGRGKWKGLDQKQRIVQHDNLTKKVTEFQKTGNTEGLEVYFGVNPNEAFAAASKKVKKPYRESKLAETVSQEHPSRKGEWEVEMGDREIDWDHLIKKKIKAQKAEVEAQRQEQIMEEAYEEIKGGSGFSGDYKYDADILADSLAEVQGKVYADLTDLERSGLYDQALKRVTRDLKTRMDFKKNLKDVEQKIELQMFDPKDRLPNESGGLAYMLGEPNTRIEGLQHAGVIADPRGLYTDPSIYTKGESESEDYMSGGRADFIFGGSAGLKAMWKQMMKGISKRRGESVTKLFPKLSSEERAMEKLVMGTPEQKAFREGEVTHKIEGIDLLINRLRHDKKILERQAKNKAIGDTGLDFVMKQLEKDMPEVYGPHLKKYTDIDRDILQLENIKKNLLTKDRKLHYEGGGVGRGPWTTGQKAPEPQGQAQTPFHPAQSQVNPMKAPQGIPSLAPRTMDPKYIQQQRMQQMMAGMGQQGQRPGMMGQPRRRMEEGGPSVEEFRKDKMHNEMMKWMHEYEQYKKNYEWEKRKRSGIQEAADGGKIDFRDNTNFKKEPWYVWPYKRAQTWDRYLEMLKQKMKRKSSSSEGGRIGLKHGSNLKVWGKTVDEQWPNLNENQKNWIRENFPDAIHQKSEGGRIGFGLGGFNKARRAFLKMMAGFAGAGVAAGTGLLKLGKAAKVVPKVTETIVQSNAAGMPAWFPSLVKRVLKEGDDITAKAGSEAMERQTVHTIKLPESGTPVQVTRDLVTDDIIVDIGEQTKHGWPAGRHGQPTQLILKKGEWIEPTKGKKGIKTKDEFIVDEAEFTGGHPENVKFEETVQFKYGDHGSDFSEIEQYAMKKHSSSVESVGEVSRAQRREGMWGKKEQARQLAMDKKHGGLKSTYKKDPHVRGKQADKDAWAEGRAESQAEEFDEFASGGLARLLGE